MTYGRSLHNVPQRFFWRALWSSKRAAAAVAILATKCNSRDEEEVDRQGGRAFLVFWPLHKQDMSCIHSHPSVHSTVFGNPLFCSLIFRLALTQHGLEEKGIKPPICWWKPIFVYFCCEVLHFDIGLGGWIAFKKQPSVAIWTAASSRSLCTLLIYQHGQCLWHPCVLSAGAARRSTLD